MPEGVLPKFLLHFHEASCFCLVPDQSLSVMEVQSFSWPEYFPSVLRITEFQGWKCAYSPHDLFVWFCLEMRKMRPRQAKRSAQGDMVSGRARTRILQVLLVLEEINPSLSSSQHSLCIQVEARWLCWPQLASALGCMTDGSMVWPSTNACALGLLGYTLGLPLTLGFTLNFFP